MDSEETPLKENRDTKSDIENNTKMITSRKKIKDNEGFIICLCLILSLSFMIVSLCLCERNRPDEQRMCS